MLQHDNKREALPFFLFFFFQRKNVAHLLHSLSGKTFKKRFAHLEMSDLVTTRWDQPQPQPRQENNTNSLYLVYVVVAFNVTTDQTQGGGQI